MSNMIPRMLGASILVIVLLFLSGCIDEPKNRVILLSDVNGSFSDSNQVKVSVNDTTPDYLFSKLAAGSNISLAILNPGGDEQVEISASGSFTTDTNCSTSPDCNNNYFKLNPTANQTVSGGFSSNFTGAIQALTNQPISIGNSGAARINDINFYGAFFQANPDAGRGASVFPANRCAFEITNTEICFDFNNTSRSTGLREGMLNPNYYYKLGASSTNKGLRSYGPATSLYTQWGPNPSEMIRPGDLLVMNYNDSNGIQPLLFQDNGWYPETRKVYYGKPNDFLNDANHVGDINHTGSYDINGNINSTGNVVVGGEINVTGNILGGSHLSIAGTGQFGGSIDTNYVNSSLGGFFGQDTNFNNIGVSGNVYVDGNVYGQTMSLFSAIGTSCNALCGSVVVDAPWVCVEARTTAGASSTCSQTTTAVNCICKN